MLKNRFTALTVIVLILSASAMAQYSSPVRDVENPGHSPFWAVGSVNLTAGGFSGSFGTSIATVPAGKRVVLEYVGVSCETAPGDSITEVRLQIPRNLGGGASQLIGFPLSVSRQGNATFVQKWVGAGPVKLYAENTPAFTISFGFARSNNAEAAFCAVFLSGFTINAP